MTLTNDADSGEQTDDFEMTRRGFGFGTFALSSGIFTIGWNRDREATAVWDRDDFEFVRANMHDNNINNGFETYVFCEWEEPVSNQPVTVTIYSEKGKKLKEKSFRFDGTAGARIIENVWRFPFKVVVELG